MYKRASDEEIRCLTLQLVHEVKRGNPAADGKYQALCAAMASRGYGPADRTYIQSRLFEVCGSAPEGNNVAMKMLLSTTTSLPAAVKDENGLFIPPKDLRLLEERL